VEWGLELVRQLLDDHQPMNLNRDAITVTAEGPAVGIVLLPHQDLGGYSLVLRVDDRHVMLVWAGVTDLKYHDDIDLGREVLRIDRRTSAGNDAIAAAMASEFSRPIRVISRQTRIRRRWQLLCAVEVSNRWLESYVADTKAPDMEHTGREVDAGITSLLGPGRPMIRQPVPLAAWHRLAEPAWPVT
jgi:hypothetical protein